MPGDDEQLSPADVAWVDQADALVDELVRHVREHLTYCPHKGAGHCIGVAAFHLIDNADCGMIATALGGAVARLAQLEQVAR